MAFLPLKSAFKNQVFTAVRTSISGTDEIDTVIKHASSIRKKKTKKKTGYKFMRKFCRLIIFFIVF